jgi:hypothetical protein
MACYITANELQKKFQAGLQTAASKRLAHRKE